MGEIVILASFTLLENIMLKFIFFARFETSNIKVQKCALELYCSQLQNEATHQKSGEKIPQKYSRLISSIILGRRLFWTSSGPALCAKLSITQPEFFLGPGGHEFGAL